MTDRDDDAAALAAKMGWEWVPEEDADPTSIPWSDGQDSGVFRLVYPCVGANEVEGFPQTMDVEDLIYCPLPDAPLHAHLEFVGRIAEACGLHVGICDYEVDGETRWSASMWMTGNALGRRWSNLPDLSHAAIRAALAAKGGAS
jgi:hypothetical protein